MSLGRRCCRCGVGLLITLGLTGIFLWISLHSSKPTLKIVDFYVPALNKTASVSNATAGKPPRNTTILFILEINNKNKDAGIYYDALNVTFYCGKNHSFMGNVTVDSFYQGHKKTAKKKVALQVERRAFWEEVSQAVSNGTKVVFWVDLETRVRYKVMTWKTDHRTMRLEGEVQVNDTGTESKEDGVELHSRSAAHFCYLTPTWKSLAAVLLFFWVW
ncbi:protein NDR1-like [Magnolia sinica]|uniref:protein NDR1-like n=1 Tax=Magnolia sinica TaxID=86752 RepID=UPI00265AC158|nr:protein NDR1-like [Magnolia sinica]